VIDFGGLAIGDPACDLVIAWKFFRKAVRDICKASLPFNDATWERGKAWALWKALIVAAGLTDTNSVEAESAWGTIEEILKHDTTELMPSLKHIEVVLYDPTWPQVFEEEEARVIDIEL
jgi:aminoglycoside phosphotransferase (APT) family kinase protein